MNYLRWLEVHHIQLRSVHSSLDGPLAPWRGTMSPLGEPCPH
jgi:hypothetical protein